MKIFRPIALLLLLASISVFLTKRNTIYAASSSQSNSAAKSSPATASGAAVYQQKCALCHGEKMEGIPPAFPSLAGVGHRSSADQVSVLVHQGRGRMPGFSNAQLSPDQLASLLAYLATDPTFNTPTANSAAMAGTTAANDPGASVYQQNCTFCHGRDAAGGETGPDLTRSKLVAADVNGDQIGPVIRNGRADGKMPRFNFSEVELADLVKFIHTTAKLAASRPGGRRGVDVADLQTGNVAEGRAYFEGAGGCAKCHSPTGDLAGIASRHQGLQLEERMLYPRDAKDTLIVTLPSGQTVKGILEYQDEFTVGLRDSTGTYRSWPVNGTKFVIDSPVTAHVDQFTKYTDADIHNLMAYLQTLK